MTKLLERAIEGVRQLPEQEQDDRAGFLLAHLGAWVATPDEEAALSQAEAEIVAGKVVPEADMRAFWTKQRS